RTAFRGGSQLLHDRGRRHPVRCERCAERLAEFRAVGGSSHRPMADIAEVFLGERFRSVQQDVEVAHWRRIEDRGLRIEELYATSYFLDPRSSILNPAMD